MATGSYQYSVTCAICEGTEDVHSYCLICKGPMCRICVVTHTRTPMFRKHRIVTLGEGLQNQKEEEECRDHPPYICTMHCNVCHKPVCSKCVGSRVHKGHDIGEIEAALQRVRQEVAEYRNILETRYLSQYREKGSNIKQEKRKCKLVALALKSDINKKRTEVIREIHKVCDDMINKVDDEEKQQNLEIDIYFQNVQESAKEIELLISQSKEALTKLASELLQFNQEKPSLSHLELQDAPKIVQSTFVSATINRENVAEQVGKLMSNKHLLIDTSIIHRTMRDTGIGLIDAADENQAWIKVYEQNELWLVNTDGNVEKCINIKSGISDFVVSTSANIIAAYYGDGCVRIITQTGQVMQTINTDPYKPTGVCIGNNKQDIVVCVTTPDLTRGKVLVYNSDGEELCTITYTDKPVRKWISQRVTQNNRGDYCVAHRDHKKVYVMNTNGGLRWTYDGSGGGKLGEDFVPGDICSDFYNHLIILDISNHKIHMLDGEGNFLRFLLTEQDGMTKPYGLCMDQDGRLWVGHLDGGLCVVKYLK